MTLYNSSIVADICSVLNSAADELRDRDLQNRYEKWQRPRVRTTFDAAFERLLDLGAASCVPPAVLKELIRLVEAWNQARRSVKTLLRELPELRPYIVGDNQWFLELPVCAIPSLDGSGLSLRIIPESPHYKRRESEFDGSPEAWQEIDKDYARRQFVALLLSPDREWLSEGPCDRCGLYYIKKTRGQKKYCSKECARNAKHSTAKDITARTRKLRHEKQVQLARKLTQRWAATRTRQDWKHWVSERAEAQGVPLTPKFLTRAVNKGELIEPKKRDR